MTLGFAMKITRLTGCLVHVSHHVADRLYLRVLQRWLNLTLLVESQYLSADVCHFTGTLTRHMHLTISIPITLLIPPQTLPLIPRDYGVKIELSPCHNTMLGYTCNQPERRWKRGTLPPHAARYISIFVGTKSFTN